MDPISIIGLLASLATLIETSNSVCNAVKTFKDTIKEIAEISSNVSVFTEALKGFDRVLRGRQTMHRISPLVIKTALDNSQDTIKDLEELLLQLASYESLTIRRMKWVQQKADFRRLLDKLKEQNAVLQTFLALTHTETFLSVVSQHSQFALLCSYNEDQETVLPEHTFLSPPAHSLPPISNASSLDSSERRTSYQSDQLSFISLSSSFATSISSQSDEIGSDEIESFPSISGSTSTQTLATKISTEPLSTSQNSRPRLGSQASSQNVVLIHKACRYSCYCACHEQESAPSQKKKFTKKNAKVRCTESTCHNATVAESQHSGYSKSFRQALSQVMSSKSIKVRYNLNTYRMVSEGSDAFRSIKHGNLDKLKASIDSGDATLWDTAPDGWSLLHTAAYNRQLPIVKYLLDMGAETDTGDIGSRIPGHFAILKSVGADATQVEHDILDLFSKKDDCMIDFEFTPVHVAVLGIYDVTDEERPSLEAIIELVDEANNAPLDTDWKQWQLKYRTRSPLFGAVLEFFRASAYEQPYLKPIHNLIDQKDKKNCWTPLHWAASAGRIDKMKTLLLYGADPFILSNLDQSILHAAAESKIDRGLAAALEIWKPNAHKLSINQINRWNETALHIAAWCSAACVKLLLEAGANPSVQQEDGQVPLHCAGLSGQGPDRREIVSLLCSAENKAHINTQDKDGRPPIFDFLDDSDCVDMLIQSGAKLDLCDLSKRTFFHHACIQDESDALRTALRLGIDPAIATMEDEDGNTAVMEALSHGYSNCALVLLELSDVGNTMGKDGWHAVHFAAKIGDPEVLEAVFKLSSFEKGLKTTDGKSIELVAMEAGTWSGKVKSLVRKYNSLV